MFKNPKFWVSVAAVFVFVMVFDFFFHGYFLDSTYQATSRLWRSDAEMQSFLPLMIFGQLSVGVIFIDEILYRGEKSLLIHQIILINQRIDRISGRDFVQQFFNTPSIVGAEESSCPTGIDIKGSNLRHANVESQGFFKKLFGYNTYRVQGFTNTTPMWKVSVYGVKAKGMYEAIDEAGRLLETTLDSDTTLNPEEKGPVCTYKTSDGNEVVLWGL